MASHALAPDKPHVTVQDERGFELQRLLEARNGFYAFESALHVFSSTPSGAIDEGATMSAEYWNERPTWKAEFDGMADRVWCFAEDVFGVQFAVHDGKIVSFDPETGDIGHLADDIGGWIDAIMTRYRELTGYPLAHEWQSLHGPLAPSRRLLPRVPFVLGGAFAISNLYDGDALQGMRARGHVAVQIRDLPDGSTVEYVPAG